MGGKRFIKYSANTLLTVLWSEHAEIPNRSAEVPGNSALPAGFLERSRWAETNAGSGAFLWLHGRPCESLTYVSRSLCFKGKSRPQFFFVFCPAFVHMQYSPSITAVIEILSNKVQIYSSQLCIHAHFTGIRYKQIELELSRILFVLLK